jgi:hypothetical protein
MIELKMNILEKYSVSVIETSKWSDYNEWLIFCVWPPLCTSHQGFWLEIQMSGFDSWRYQIFWEVVDPLSLVSTTEELLVRKSSGSGLENRDYGRRDPLHWLRNTPLSAKAGTKFADKWQSLSR